MGIQKFESYHGRVIAVDASMHIYQFMIMVGRVGDQTLTNEAGDSTSHLQGMLHRTARMLEAGFKPVFVFDGKPPEMKSQELGKRKEKREEATTALAEAKETGDAEAVDKLGKRTVRVTKQHNEECKRLLRLMGVPVVEAPSEAEAQCAELCRANRVYTVATEDMDVLTFGTPRVTRNLMVPEAQKKPILEFNGEKMLEQLDMDMDKFIDMCILCGCDYTATIRGIGPSGALKNIKKYGSIEKIVENLDPSKYGIPEDWPYAEARKMFKNPEVTPAAEVPEFKWTLPDAEGMKQFMVDEMNFNEDRIMKVVEKLKASKQKGQQGRLESFFGVPTVKSSTLKRKEPEVKGKGIKGALANKKSKGVSGGKKK
eukprot:gene7940-9433_t